MTFGAMISMIKRKRIPSSIRTTNNMMRTNYRLKTMVLMIMTLIVKKMDMLMMISLKVRRATMILSVKKITV